MTWTLNFADAFARRMRAGKSEAYIGATDAIVISKPFSAGEDVIVKWLLAQDSTVLEDVYGLPDGRDLFLLRREHRTQTLAEAIREQHSHVRRILHAMPTFKE